MTATRSKSTFPPKVLLIVAAAALSARGCGAFAPDPEIINQVLDQVLFKASTLPNPTVAPLDELLFVAANLLDSSKSQSNQKIPHLLSPPVHRRNKKISLMVQTELTAQPSTYDLYDYESRSVPGSLALTLEEEALFQLIRNVRDKYSPSTTIRVAGGWVRDKLLYGKDTPSRDIDFVLSDTSGVDFADKVCKYLREESDENQYVCVEIPEKNSKGEQADHLQTASLSINCFDLDFARLRYERYDSTSRIPEKIGVASVVEDAWRRDLTINALYYNVNTNQVEDWTEQGLNDLILQAVATPKKPLPTLLEDPIRILRAIRFAAQLSFNMSPALVRAARDVRVRYALKYKVSRDAIGKAMDEMFGTRARDPTQGVKLLMATNLIDVVFPLEEQDDVELLAVRGEAAAALPPRTSIYNSGLQHLSRTQSLVTRIFLSSSKADWDVSKRRYLWYASFLKPVYDASSVSGKKATSKRGRRHGSPFISLLTDALKRPKADVQSIERILKGAESFRMLLDRGEHRAIQRANKSQASRQDLRWLMYKTLKPCGNLWKEALILALTSSRRSLSDCVDEYNDLVALIEDRLDLGTILLDTNKIRPLLNGSQIQERALPGVSGKGFKQIMQAQEEWQVRNFCHHPDTANGVSKDMEAQLIENLVTAFPEYANAGIT